MKKSKGFTLIEGMMIAVILAIVGGLVTCVATVESTPKKVANYSKGEMVISEVDEKKGQITSVSCTRKECTYWVKFWTDEGFDESAMREFEFKRNDGF